MKNTYLHTLIFFESIFACSMFQNSFSIPIPVSRTSGWTNFFSLSGARILCSAELPVLDSAKMIPTFTPYNLP